MRIIFNINYNTHRNQRLFIVGSCVELGSWREAMAQKMTFVGDGNWQCEIEAPDNLSRIDYQYFVAADGEKTIREWSRGHSLTIASAEVCRAYDQWLNIPDNLPFYSSAFTKAIFSQYGEKEQDVKKGNEKLILSVLAPKVGRDQYVALVGEQQELGEWQPERALRMFPADNLPEWSIALDAAELSFPFSYKFIVCDKKNPSLCTWEAGDNRYLNYPFLSNNEETVHVSGGFFKYGDNLPLWKGAGTVIPVFSLRSEHSYGVGDLGDLHLLVDWMKKTNQSLIQVLPMNDTRMTHTKLDSYPYSAISIYALHPMYIDLSRLGKLKDATRRKYYELRQQKLNLEDEVDYEAVVETKMAYIQEFVEQEGLSSLLMNEAFDKFFEKSQFWLMPYAAYCYLRDKNKTADFDKWGKYSVYNELTVKRLCSPENEAYPEIALNYYIQYVLDSQFRDVTDYARLNGVVLKGDLPIGVNRHSVEVWTDPESFNLNGQSGAPPDDFSTIGQNWLFPTYNWEEMAKDGYSWWKNRFAKMNDYFDCFRIDHILGFFRIWEIPEEYVQGLCGHFNPSLPLSKEEIETFGLNFNEKWFVNPRVEETYLPELFGNYADEVKASYLAQSSSHHFVLKPFCDTQRKIKGLFAGKEDEKSNTIRLGLYAIANELLFLKDPRQEGKFHPRISASSSFLYRELNENDKRAFNRLYDDYYYHRHNQYWKTQALTRLEPLVASTEMLVCGEDLGMIPATVPEVMQQLQLLSLEIERMPKVSGVEFANLSTLPYSSVCTTSTHDMSPLRSWWMEDRSKTQRYYNQVLNRGGEAPELCTSELAVQVLRNHLLSPAMLAIIPWQDWMAIDEELKREDYDAERINIPSKTNHFWRYRMHLTLEELLEAENLNRRISSLIDECGRV